MAKLATFFAIFPVNKHPLNSNVICRCMSTYEVCDLVSLGTSSCRCRSTYEVCDLVPLVTSRVGDSELIIHFQEAYARLF